jgi:hypothetical protein
VEDVGTRLIVSDARPIDRVAEQAASNGASVLRVRVNRGAIDADVLDRLDELFSSHPGRCRVAFQLVGEDGSEATIDFSSAVSADGELVERVREICGAESVAELQ